MAQRSLEGPLRIDSGEVFVDRFLLRGCRSLRSIRLLMPPDGLEVPPPFYFLSRAIGVPICLGGGFGSLRRFTSWLLPSYRTELPSLSSRDVVDGHRKCRPCSICALVLLAGLGNGLAVSPTKGERNEIRGTRGQFRWCSCCVCVCA